jgi:hypothetical protein
MHSAVVVHSLNTLRCVCVYVYVCGCDYSARLFTYDIHAIMFASVASRAKKNHE